MGANLRERYGDLAIGDLVEVMSLCDGLTQDTTIWRNTQRKATIERIRALAKEANSNICRAVFPRDTLSDLEPPLALVVRDGQRCETKLGQRRAKERAQAGQVPEPVDAA